MILTKKATIGFILLAIITFTLATYSYNIQPTIPVQTPNHESFNDLVSTSLHQSSAYTPLKPLVNFGEYTPLAITVSLELFAFVCYILLKRVEPKIKAWEERVRKEREAR
jgi:hypothetical protein